LAKQKAVTAQTSIQWPLYLRLSELPNASNPHGKSAVNVVRTRSLKKSSANQRFFETCRTEREEEMNVRVRRIHREIIRLKDDE